MRFANREEAGRRLADMLLHYERNPDTVVLALPRGGVPIGYELSRRLGLPLDIFFVKKIPSPYNEEVGIGAVSENGHIELNEDAVRALRVEEEYIRRRVSEKLEAMKSKRALYAKPLPNFDGKTLILCDDGIATGSSMLLSVDAAAKAGVKKVVVAVPVAPLALLDILEEVADEVYVLEPVEELVAVGYYYSDFHQLDDEEVMDYLDRSMAL
jgi:predicted phosphoribosyltransferase